MIQRKNKSYKTGNHHLLHFTHKYRVHVFIVLLCLFRFYNTDILHASEEESVAELEVKEVEEIEETKTTLAERETRHTVESGDKLWHLASKYYDNPAMWRIIHEANKDTIEDEDHLDIGQILIIPEMHPEPPGLLEAPIESGTIIIISDSTVMRRKKWFWLSLQATFQLLSKDSTEGNFAIAIGCDKEVEPHIILPPYEPGESSVLELNKAKSIVGKLGLNSTVQDAFYILGSIPGIVKETKFDKPNLVLMIGTEWSYGGHAYTEDLDLSKEKLTDTINSLTIVHFSTSADDVNNDFYDGLNEYIEPLKEKAELKELYFRYGKNKDKDQENKLVRRISKILLAKTYLKKKSQKDKRSHRKPF